MPKLIDYPRTSYTSAWEVAEVVDDTGGKCALETCARKLNRKVSGSFKAIVGSAVKFGLLTSKRELLTTTTLFRRIKHAYDKQEELLFHREAFLTPPLFTQVCRKFRARELPVAMLDVLLIREFDVEEINAQNVAKSFVDGARMVGVLDEHNVVADIDQLAARQAARRELASPSPGSNAFRSATPAPTEATSSAATGPMAATDAPPTARLAAQAATPQLLRSDAPTAPTIPPAVVNTASGLTLPSARPAPPGTGDAIANLFGIAASREPAGERPPAPLPTPAPVPTSPDLSRLPTGPANGQPAGAAATSRPGQPLLFRLQLSGPGVSTDLEVSDADDLTLVRALLDKIERQLRRTG